MTTNEKTFDDLDHQPHRAGSGTQARMDFPNGYGVSVVRFSVGPFGGSYGYEEGLYELAVMKNGSLCYDTPVTDDVLGHLSPDEVTAYMQRVQSLPARETVTND